MKRETIFCLMMILLCATIGMAQRSSRRPGTTPGTTSVTDIRKVDFLNFTYQSSLCSQEYGRMGIGRIVHVRNGEFKNKNVYFAVAENKIIFADVNGDGHEDAIVPIDCGATTANFARAEVDIYTVENGRATLLAAINDKTLERDYRRYYPATESYWGINDDGIKANNGSLLIEVLVDGPHAAPKSIATLEYQLAGKTLTLKGKPEGRLRPTQ